jgi:hypothetical protein
VFDLLFFTFGFRQRFIVRDFQNVAANRFAEKFGQFFRRRLGVFNRIVQNGGTENVEIVNFSDICQNVRDFQRMIDIRLGIVAFALLITVFFRGKARRLQQFS